MPATRCPYSLCGQGQARTENEARVLSVVSALSLVHTFQLPLILVENIDIAVINDPVKPEKSS